MNIDVLEIRDRRIIKELTYIRKNYTNISINYTDDDKMYLDIKTQKGNILHFNISKDHPFKPPILEIQTTHGSYNYREQLNAIPKSIYYYLYYPQDLFVRDKIDSFISKDSICLCCKSLLCGANWSPAITIYNIINEIEQNNKSKQIIGYKLSLNNFFKIKNIPLDILSPIISFLL